MRFGEKVLYSGASEHTTYQVVEKTYTGRPARLLYAGRRTPQSGLALDDDPELLFDYNQRFLEIVMSLRPSSILVIGGGAFTLPSVLSARFGQTSIEVVEIDKLLVEIADEFFDLSKLPNMTITVADGYEYLQAQQKQYDLIIVDAFMEYDIPDSLVNKQAATLYAEHLTPGGAVAMNFIGRYGTTRRNSAHQLFEAFAAAFSHVTLLPADASYAVKAEQNIILVAAQREVALAYVQSQSVELVR